MSKRWVELRRAGSILGSNPRYRRLYAARVISVFGSQFTNLALAFGVLSLHHANASSLGLVFAASSASGVVFLLAGGVLGDRFRRDVLLWSSDLVSGASVASTAVLFATHHASVASLMVLAFIGGGAGAVRGPALVAVMPEIVSAEERQSANAVIGMSTNAASVIGPAVAGVLVSTVGFVAAFSVDAASYFFSILLISGMRLKPRIEPDGARPSAFRQLADGWSAFTEYRWVVTIVAGFMALNAAFTGVILVLGPIVMHTHFHGPSSWAEVLTIGAIGSVAGSAVAIRTRPHRPMVVALLWCIPMVLFGATLVEPIPLLAIALCSFLVNLGGEIFGVLWITALQNRISSHVLARVSSYDQLGSFLAIPLGLSIVGFIASATSVRATLFGCVGVGVIALLAMFADPEVRKMADLPASVTR